ncbi:MAG TPA: DUF1648 domain-containing protein [Candidatus Angelobacter sp.]|nr:DUF1648 domain-containing protein [Candidatus Angelobacter sp.]
MDSRLPKLVFVLLALYAAIHFSYYYPQLPGVVASHFDKHGAANGWQTKAAFFNVFIGVSVLAVVIGFAIPKIIFAVPPQLINLPNKQYWLAPQHRVETNEFFSAYFAWFGCAMYLLLIVVFDYAIRSNLHPGNPPDPARMWYVLAGFLIFMIGSTIRMLTKFLRPPQEKPGS